VLLLPSFIATLGVAVMFQPAFLLTLHRLARKLLVALIAVVGCLREEGLIV
jgi:hypothetical protein